MGQSSKAGGETKQSAAERVVELEWFNRARIETSNETERFQAAYCGMS
jgi:hypothetical protein